MRRNLIETTRFALILALVVFAGSARLVAAPNVIVFLIDDLGYKDLGCYGSKFYETPRIDQLAQQSVRFTDFYSAHPVCSPTRAAFLTGKTPHRVGITQWIAPRSGVVLSLDEVTIGEAFSDAGYRTGYIGKWHVGEDDEHMPDRQGFEWKRCVNRAGQPSSYFFPYKRKPKKNQKVKGETRPAVHDVPDLADGKSGDYLTDKLTDYAIEFIESNREQPFFLCFAHYAVHTPIQAPTHLVALAKKRKATNYGETETPLSDESGRASTRDRQDHPTYAAMMSNLDTNVGRVLDRLEALDLSKDTIIIFTSDNGGLSTLPRKRVGPTSVRPLRAGKGWTYEGGIRIPTLVSWPGKIEAGQSSTPAITMDLYPTLLELCELPQRPQQHVDGRSLVSALNRKPDSQLQERTLAWYYPHAHGSGHQPSSAMRHGNWKIVHRQTDDSYQLYDLANDVSESKELSAKFPGKMAELRERLQGWLKETAAQPNPLQ